MGISPAAARGAELLDVEAGAERLAGTRHHDDPHVRVDVGPVDRGKILPLHLVRPRVVALRAERIVATVSATA